MLHKQDRHNCSLMVNLKLFLSDLSTWRVHITGCHVPNESGVTWTATPSTLAMDEKDEGPETSGKNESSCNAQTNVLDSTGNHVPVSNLVSSNTEGNANFGVDGETRKTVFPSKKRISKMLSNLKRRREGRAHHSTDFHIKSAKCERSKSEEMNHDIADKNNTDIIHSCTNFYNATEVANQNCPTEAENNNTNESVSLLMNMNAPNYLSSVNVENDISLQNENSNGLQSEYLKDPDELISKFPSSKASISDQQHVDSQMSPDTGAKCKTSISEFQQLSDHLGTFENYKRLCANDNDSLLNEMIGSSVKEATQRYFTNSVVTSISDIQQPLLQANTLSEILQQASSDLPHSFEDFTKYIDLTPSSPFLHSSSLNDLIEETLLDVESNSSSGPNPILMSENLASVSNENTLEMSGLSFETQQESSCRTWAHCGNVVFHSKELQNEIENLPSYQEAAAVLVKQAVLSEMDFDDQSSETS